jgi:N-methylhydantoinase B
MRTYTAQEKGEEGKTKDKILVEVLRGYLNSATREMASAFDRTAYDPVITEIRDYGLALFDKKVRLVAESVGVPAFSGTLKVGIKSALEVIGEENLDQGDVIWNNWPYWNGSQVNDVTLAAPIFHGDEVVGYSAAKAHVIDIGQKDPAYCIDTTDVYQEGLKLPAVKIVKKGKVDVEIERIIKFNCRAPDRVMGNIYAQISAVQTGVKRVKEIIKKYGLSEFEYCCDEIIKHGERLARLALRELPKGTWSAEDFMDNNVLSDEPIRLHVKVTITESEFIVDYSGSSKQVEGTVNCPLGISVAVANSSFKSITTMTEPANEGQYAPVRVIAPEGSIFNPMPPAGVFLIWPAAHAWDLIRKALIQAMPYRIPACSTGDCYSLMISGGFSESYKYDHFYIFTNDHGGGLGAFYQSDGENAVVHDALAGGQNTPVEVNEALSPVMVMNWALIPDSGGAGKFRGGLGMVEEVKILNRSRVTTILFRRKSAPWGFNGGKEGRPGRNLFFVGTEKEFEASTHSADFEPGDVIRVESGGGGGWGDPLERDPDAVSKDVFYGYVSPEQARHVYGVVLNGDLSVDYEATERLRNSLRAKK